MLHGTNVKIFDGYIIPVIIFTPNFIFFFFPVFEGFICDILKSVTQAKRPSCPQNLELGVYTDPIPFNSRTENEIARRTVNTPLLVIVAILSAEKWNIVTEIKIRHSFHCVFIQ